MNAVGIDVSKNKSMVAVARPLGQVVVKPFEVRHTAIELKKLADFLKSLDGETRVVMEHTGRYYEPVAQYIHASGVFVSAVNPLLIKEYGTIRCAASRPTRQIRSKSPVTPLTIGQRG